MDLPDNCAVRKLKFVSDWLIALYNIWLVTILILALCCYVYGIPFISYVPLLCAACICISRLELTWLDLTCRSSSYATIVCCISILIYCTLHYHSVWCCTKISDFILYHYMHMYILSYFILHYIILPLVSCYALLHLILYYIIFLYSIVLYGISSK